MSETRYFHGGIPGLKPGDKVKPPSETGNEILLQYAKHHPDSVQRADRVYLTSSIDAARMFAFAYPYGTVYEVEPDAPTEHDPDCDLVGLSFQCPSATVVRAVRKNVGRTERERAEIVGALMGP